MRLLYVAHAFPPESWAGTEVYTLALATEMRERGHEVTVFTRSAAAGRDQRQAPDFSLRFREFRGLPVWEMPHRLAYPSLRHTYVEPRAETAFRDVIAKARPDVVHFQHLIHLSASLPHVCRALHLPSVITVHDYWPLCPRVQLIRPDGVRCEENQGSGCVLCVNDHRYHDIPRAKRLLPLVDPFVDIAGAVARRAGWTQIGTQAGRYRDLVDRPDYVCRAYAASDLVIAPSRFLRQKLLDTGHFSARTLIYSDNGTPTDRTITEPHTRDVDGRLRFGFVGSLLWYKGADVLIRAMQQLRSDDAVLHVFGPFTPDCDPYHAQLRDLAARSDGRVIFHGRFDHARLAEVYADIDVLVVPSLWFENSPVTIHEAFAFRRPVVTSNIGGMAELVQHERNGLLFEAGRVDDLAAALTRVCREPGLRDRLREFPPIKAIAQDAADMETRYRAVIDAARAADRAKQIS